MEVVDRGDTIERAKLRLHLVEEVEGTGPSEEEGKQERDGAECLLTAGEQRDRARVLAGRTGDDLDARLENVDALGTTLSPELLAAIDKIRWEDRDPAA